MSDKLNINNEMAQLDRKNRKFYDELTDEEKKKFSTFLMLRWGSSVQADSNIQAYYVMSTNENLNENFFDISRHPKLQWLCATAVSPGIGTFKHQWIAPKKKDSAGSSKSIKFLREMFPGLKDDEIDLLRRINTDNDLKELARKHGWDEKRIKSDL
jgi:hypothetical protein